MTDTIIPPTRDQLRERVHALAPPAQQAVAARWPNGVPSLKTDDHTPGQLAQLHRLIEVVETEFAGAERDEPVEAIPPAPVAPKQPTGSSRTQIVERLSKLPPDALTEIASRWPAGVPTFKQKTDHDAGQLAAIEKTIGGVVFDLNIDEPDRVEKTEVARADQLKARYRRLTPDLLDRVDIEAMDRGIPQAFTFAGNYVEADLDIAEELIAAAEETVALRRRTVHAALGDAGLNEDDDIRHGIIRYLSAGRTASSSDLTAAECERIVEAAKAVELDQAAITFGEDGGKLILVSADGMPFPVAAPYELCDLKAWARANGRKIGEILGAATELAPTLGLSVPKTIRNLTHPRLITLILRQLEGSAPVVAAKPSSADGGEVTPEPVTAAVAGDEAASPPGPDVITSSSSSSLVVVHGFDGRIHVAQATREVAAQVLDLLGDDLS